MCPIPVATARIFDDPHAMRGGWTLMPFAGGPPAPGQVTATIHVDPIAGRHMRSDRERVGGESSACELDTPDDATWSALADRDLHGAMAHPERVPSLVLDAGDFACTHRGTRIAVSDALVADAAAVDATAALRRLAAALDRALADWTAAPRCAAL